MHNIKALVGKRIKQLRKECLISQEQLALKAGLDRTYINSVENGKRNISIVNIMKICTALNCNISHFFYSDIFKGGLNG